MKIVTGIDCVPHAASAWLWHADEWGIDWANYAFEAANAGGIPRMFIALDEDDTAVGTALITERDLPGREDLAPWLAGVYVNHDCRGSGVGRNLVVHVMNVAAALDIEALYLFVYHSNLQEFYSQLGWEFYEEGMLDGQTVFIMRWKAA
jgi:predicted N-acetyltransferase YhbS